MAEYIAKGDNLFHSLMLPASCWQDQDQNQEDFSEWLFVLL
jgi:hypothetical protein